MSNLFPGSRVLRVRRPTLVVPALMLLAASVVQPPRAEAQVLPMCLGKQATIIGSSKANTLKGTKKADVIVGLGGNDRIVGAGGGDRICGGAGADRLFGGVGNDRMNGGKGADQCLQEAGSGTKKSCEGPTFPLTVSKAGTGTGVVTSSPPAIDCGQTCVSGYFEGQKVTLMASAVGPSTFDGWGGACTGTGSCAVVMSKSNAVTATFSTGSGSPSPPGSPPGGSVSCVAPCFVVSRTGDTYKAVSPSGESHSGGLSLVVGSAVASLNGSGGGDVVFTAGIFDLGGARFSLHNIADIEFAGQGMDATLIQNLSTEAKDSEPFDMHEADRIVIRDMTVNAGGPFRASSDAIDFDGGNGGVIERVKIAQSRSRGIVFDGKDFTSAGVPRTADQNMIRDCVVIGIPGDGIELLAARNNRIEGCRISNVGGRGIQVTKSAPNPIGQGGAGVQTNKKSRDNVLVGNIIDRAGQHGIEILSSDANTIDANAISNSGRDGIRITAQDDIPCNGNVVRNTVATDNQRTRVQYGLNIPTPLCNGTVVGPNNAVNPINDKGTNTQYP